MQKPLSNKERQARRRQKEKIWLAENGWGSWEAIHTALLKGWGKLVSVKSKNKNIDKREVSDGDI